MANILASWELGWGYGHIAGLAPVSQVLRDAGHSVTLAAREPATADRLTSNPFNAVVQAPIHPAPPVARPTLTYASVIEDGGFGDVGAASALVRGWLRIFENAGADALLSEHAPASLLAAHIAGLPAARLGIGFTAPPPLRPFPSLLPWTGAGEAERAEADAVADEVVAKVCKAFGAAPLDSLVALLATAPAYLSTWPELDIYGARSGARYYGPMSGFGGAARPAWPEGEGPRTFVYLSIGHRLAGELAAALGALGWPTLWHSAMAPDALPPNIRYSPEPLDMRYVLDGAALQVGRAGHASLCEGLAFGRPQLMLPDTLETLLLAARVAKQGLGLMIGNDAPAGQVRAALDRLAADREVAARVSAFRDRYAAYDPQAATRELARDLLAGWRLD